LAGRSKPVGESRYPKRKMGRRRRGFNILSVAPRRVMPEPRLINPIGR
jgi:hypothetical protein